MADAKVAVITRPRTMSGRRGGLTLLLDPQDAKEWVRKRWADLKDEPKKAKKES